jgi:hypothetical protein
MFLEAQITEFKNLKSDLYQIQQETKKQPEYLEFHGFFLSANKIL